jgi:hypothetical protein
MQHRQHDEQATGNKQRGKEGLIRFVTFAKSEQRRARFAVFIGILHAPRLRIERPAGYVKTAWNPRWRFVQTALAGQ